MAETKTKPTAVSVDAYLCTKASPEQLIDCKTIAALCERITQQPPKMWGANIVGFGSYFYCYESGHLGQACLVGFAIRGKEIVIYLTAESPAQCMLLTKLGKHKMGKSCLYFKRLTDLNVEVLEVLIVESIAEIKLRYPDGGENNRLAIKQTLV